MCRDRQRTAIPHETLTAWQMAFTAPDYQAYPCIAFVGSTIILFLCNRPILEVKHLNWAQPSSKLPRAFSLCSWVPHEDKSCPQGTVWTGSPASHKKEAACLMMNGLHPFLGPQAHPLSTASLHLPFPVERLAGKASLPRDVSLTLWTESLSQKRTSAVQELIVGQFHLFVCKYRI